MLNKYGDYKYESKAICSTLSLIKSAVLIYKLIINSICIILSTIIIRTVSFVWRRAAPCLDGVVALYVLERAGGAADGGPAAPVKSRAEQRIENGLLIMLRLNYSSERHLEKVTLKVSIILSKYCKNVFFVCREENRLRNARCISLCRRLHFPCHAFPASESIHRHTLG